MKYLLTLIMVAGAMACSAQDVVGTWQQTNEQTCLQSEFTESKTEEELVPQMGKSSFTVARLISFDRKGKGKEGIFTKGNKKGTDKNDFSYQIAGSELQFLDPKSGIITMRFVIDELTESTMTIHNAMKDCEKRSFARVK